MRILNLGQLIATSLSEPKPRSSPGFDQTVLTLKLSDEERKQYASGWRGGVNLNWEKEKTKRVNQFKDSKLPNGDRVHSLVRLALAFPSLNSYCYENGALSDLEFINADVRGEERTKAKKCLKTFAKNLKDFLLCFSDCCEKNVDKFCEDQRGKLKLAKYKCPHKSSQNN